MLFKANNLSSYIYWASSFFFFFFWSQNVGFSLYTVDGKVE